MSFRLTDANDKIDELLKRVEKTEATVKFAEQKLHELRLEYAAKEAAHDAACRAAQEVKP